MRWSPTSNRRRRWRKAHPAASRAQLPVLVLLLALVYGTVGYRVIEGFGWFDSLYTTVTTLTTLGGEIHPLSSSGRVFTVTLIVLGMVAVFDLLALFTTLVGSGQLGLARERRAMKRRIDDLQDHYVICAFGRVGRSATQKLSSQGVGVVVIESKPELEPELVNADVPYLIADPTRESVLEEAGIRRARGLLCAVDDDAINVYIALSARALNAELFIISRASTPESVDKLFRAGSDRVVSPYVVSGVRMASLALNPAVLEFVDMVSVAPDLRIEELAVGRDSRLDNRTVRDVCAPHPGVMVLAVRSVNGEVLLPPQADTLLHHDDVLIVLGPADAVNSLGEEAS